MSTMAFTKFVVRVIPAATPLQQLLSHAASLLPAGAPLALACLCVISCLCFYAPILAVWLAAQTPHSKGARTDVLQARYNLACPKHLPPTPVADAVAAL
jgi:hypothetical protein